MKPTLRTRNATLSLLVLLAAGLAMLACNLPVVVHTAEQESAAEVAETLAESGNFTVRSAAYSGGDAVVQIDLEAGQSQAGLVSTWVYIFDSALKSQPKAKQVVIEMYAVGQPYAVLTAQAADIRALLGGKMELPAFVQKIQVEDRRAPAEGLRQALISRGWAVTSVEITPQQVTVEGFQPDGLSKEETVQEWFQGMRLAHLYAPESQEILLRILLPEPPALAVRASMEHVRAFLDGEIDPAAFLAGLVVD